MSIYLVFLMIQLHLVNVLEISGAVLLITGATISRVQTRLLRLGLLLMGLTFAFNAFIEIYMVHMNIRVLWVIHIIQLLSAVIVIANNKGRKTSGKERNLPLF